MITDEIVLDPETLKPWEFIPQEPASDPKFVKHVRCEGARFHVLRWDTLGAHCSEKRCIVNKNHAY